MPTDSRLVRVVPGPGTRWEVRGPGGTHAVLEAESPTAAVAQARRLLTGGGSVEVLDRAGRVLETQTVPPPSAGHPWWYVRPSRLWWTLAGLFLVQAVSRFVADGFGWLGVLWLLVGVSQAACLTASHRRDRGIASPPT